MAEPESSFMIVDVIGIRGSGKSTAVAHLRDTRQALVRENRKDFTVPSWKAFVAAHPEFAEAFMEEVRRAKDIRTGKGIPNSTLRNYKQEFCLYQALREQLGDRLFVWDKGLLETMIHTVLYSEEEIYPLVGRLAIGPVFSHWPQADMYMQMDGEHKSFYRAIVRNRNEQWDRNMFDRMFQRHTALVDAFKVYTGAKWYKVGNAGDKNVMLEKIGIHEYSK